MRTRAEHLAWAKDEALAHLERGRLYSAVTAFIAAVGMHYETKALVHSPRIVLVDRYLDARDPEAIRKWIEGFQ